LSNSENIKIPFNCPALVGKELHYIADAHASGQLAGDGKYTKKCSELLECYTGAQSVLLTHSCTAALEMAAILANITYGDEIIMPSYTFVSTANAFVLRGGVPVFVDIRPDTMNIDEEKIEAAITPMTKAIVPVHYGGVPCEMEKIMTIAQRHGLLVIEDAAQALMSSYCEKPIGSLGHMTAFSFHETKNIISGEGGALAINDTRFLQRAEEIREKGTNRRRFVNGLVDKYTWVDIGSSYLPGELMAAFLFAQLEEAYKITSRRLSMWDSYKSLVGPLEESGLLKQAVIPDLCKHNGHIFFVTLAPFFDRGQVLMELNRKGINCVFHYVPLHSSPSGRKYGKISGEMTYTDSLSRRLLRLPMRSGEAEITEQVVNVLANTLQRLNSKSDIINESRV
jgi:dTDP-4-amino-4,6-dideoxygalactose transaminase